MNPPLELARFSIGMGDRFGRQARAQLAACQQAAAHGLEIIPVWNKSNREHRIIGSEPAAVRAAADAAVRVSGWTGAYYVDADHIGFDSVDRFLDSSDFFTLDVAAFIGRPAPAELTAEFLERHPELLEPLPLSGESADARSAREAMRQTASRYLLAVREAGRIYRRIVEAKGPGTFITEVSMDETAQPQTPSELLLILAALADEGVPLETIAPKFSGRFNKGVDYVGAIAQFEAEFRIDLAVIRQAIERYGLPGNLKLSVHSGSDKFSLYPVMHRVLVEQNGGVHLKTAGTTWLEELAGLAEAEGAGLTLAKHIYQQALARHHELCAPYAEVLDLDVGQLPTTDAVARWAGRQFADALRHDPACRVFNPHLRQLLHVGYKIAAEQGHRYLELLDAHSKVIGPNVTRNLFERHIRPLFLGAAPR